MQRGGQHIKIIHLLPEKVNPKEGVKACESPTYHYQWNIVFLAILASRFHDFVLAQ